MTFMKNTTIVNIALALAIVILYTLHFVNSNKNKAIQSSQFQNSSKPISIAYIKMDSMLYTYELAKKLNSEFSQKQEAFKKEYTDKRIKFEKEAAAFQEKVQRGGFLTEDRAKQEQDRLLGSKQEIEKLDYELTQKLNEMQSKINQQIIDSIGSFLKGYNASKQYDFILNSSSMLEGSPQYNITKEVSQGLNARYKSVSR
jgi:outer membrane protein